MATLTRTEIVDLVLNEHFDLQPGSQIEDVINSEMDAGTFDSGTMKTLMRKSIEIREARLADVVHEAANILHSNENGGYAGRLSELRRVMHELIETIEMKP